MIGITNTNNAIVKSYCSRAMVLGILVALSAIISGYRPFGKSFILATLCSCINLVVMNLMLGYTLFKEKAKASLIAFFSVLIRFGIMAIPLIMALTNKNFDLLGSILGLFSIQFIIIWDRLILPKLLTLKKRI